jgi:hypothetical protein
MDSGLTVSRAGVYRGENQLAVVDTAGTAVAFQKQGNYVYVNRNPPGGGHGEFES